MWFLDSGRADNEGASSPSGQERLQLELDAALAGRLRQAARRRGQPAQELARALLIRGLDKAALQAQAAAALETLTPRQQEIAWLIARGYTNHQMAESLVISPETVKTHVSNVLEKFAARNKSELRVLLLDLGIRWWQDSAAPPAIQPPRRRLADGS